MPPRYKASDETPEENFDYECLECEESFREEETSSISLSTGEIKQYGSIVVHLSSPGFLYIKTW